MHARILASCLSHCLPATLLASPSFLVRPLNTPTQYSQTLGSKPCIYIKSQTDSQLFATTPEYIPATPRFAQSNASSWHDAVPWTSPRLTTHHRVPDSHRSSQPRALSRL
ncbi:hypothetical protein KC19_VG097400 [Ceratodon purpureus]|uniref:Secreted protein n=1 Tax=Ceratodon purpureus TaxID=3225 RepID=A0A8T0HNM7_CERPU|nr:hypothetical protein KC19_VG097400 [Ceratodon purpureus]